MILIDIFQSISTNSVRCQQKTIYRTFFSSNLFGVDFPLCDRIRKSSSDVITINDSRDLIDIESLSKRKNDITNERKKRNLQNVSNVNDVAMYTVSIALLDGAQVLNESQHNEHFQSTMPTVMATMAIFSTYGNDIDVETIVLLLMLAICAIIYSSE